VAKDVGSVGGHLQALTADLATQQGLALVSQRMGELGEIEVLVNNAGVATAGDFAGASLDREIEEIKLNIEAVVSLTHYVLQGMISRQRGAIINLASVVGFQPFPHFAVYAATKAFVISFTEALAEEVKSSDSAETKNQEEHKSRESTHSPPPPQRGYTSAPVANRP